MKSIHELLLNECLFLEQLLNKMPEFKSVAFELEVKIEGIVYKFTFQ